MKRLLRGHKATLFLLVLILIIPSISPAGQFKVTRVFRVLKEFRVTLEFKDSKVIKD